MSLFSKLPSVVLYMQPYGLDFVFLKGGQPLHLDFPTTLLDNLEINDQMGFEKHIDTFIKDNKLKKQEAVIVLAESLIFEKRFPNTEPVTTESIQQFIDKVPLKPTEVTHKSISINDETLLIATNHDLFQVIANVLVKNQWTIKAAVPIHIAPSLLGSNQLSLSALKAALTNDKQVAMYNLHEPMQQSFEQSSGLNLYWIIGAVVLILAVIGFIVVENMGLVKIPGVGIPRVLATPSPTATPVPVTPTKTPIPTVVVDKSKYKITVLNGSGVAGAARLLQEKLEDKNFVVLETGNADNSAYTKTEIAVKKAVPEAFLKELQRVIKTSYELENKINELSASSEADLIITIGQEKK